MKIRKLEHLTHYAQFFLEPSNSTQRQYEALRAHFVEGHSQVDVARTFGYSPGSFRILCHQFRANPQREFFLSPRKGPQNAPKRNHLKDRICELRKQNLSVYDIQRCLLEESHERLSTVYIAEILKQEGFARLPRRADDERPQTPRPEKAHPADARLLSLEPRTIQTKFGGLFLFLPFLAQIPLQKILSQNEFPGSEMVPAAHAMRSLLALKLFGNKRHAHLMSDVFDEGLSLFSGLNVIPKQSFLREYSCRIDPRSFPRMMSQWFEQVVQAGLGQGDSFDLDFHSIPYYGDNELVEKHYIPQRSQRCKSMLAFLAYDAETRVFCYADAKVTKADQNDEVLRFVEYWKERTGRLPRELIFDSKLTTFANLHRLNQMGIEFITLRRRSPGLLDDLHSAGPSAWKRIELSNVARKHRHPRILDTKISLPDYDGPIRQIAVRDLGHEEPTILLTNQLRRSVVGLVDRYARRMIIENAISEGIEFFHLNALSSVVDMKVDCDLQLTLMANSLYRLLAAKIGHPYSTAKVSRIFRDFINASTQIQITPDAMIVRFQKRNHNPLLKAAGMENIQTPVPWLNNLPLRLVFG
jgi:hypothetical protein